MFDASSDPPPRRARARAASMVATVVALSGCAALNLGGDGSLTANVRVVAVYPLREVPTVGAGTVDRPILDTHASRAVTAQLYALLAEQTRYRFIPDLLVEELVADISASDPVEAARELSRVSGADAVVYGAVYRFQDRVGTRYAATQPASISFDLALYTSEADDVVWKGQFDHTQQALSSNFFDAWMFWSAGPHWFSSRELARLGVDKLIDELD